MMGSKDNYTSFTEAQSFKLTANENKALEFLENAILDLEHKKYNAAYINFKQFRKTFSKVILSLDIYGGMDTFSNLSNLDNFFKDQLLETNQTHDPKILRPILPILKDLHAGWQKTSTLMEYCLNKTNGRIRIAVAG